MEILVRDGRYYTIGDTGAEFIKYKNGDIIFNHKQTEELFKNGKVTADGGRAKAFVDGTALVKGIAFGAGVDGGEEPDPDDNSSESKFEETIDWIETILDRAERAIDKYEQQADNVYKTWAKRNKALEKEIAEVDNTISLYEQAKNKYLSEANSVGLDANYAAKVRNGSLSIQDFAGESDEALVEKIKNYQDLYEKYLDCVDKIDELKEREASLYAQRFEHVQSEYDNLLQAFDHTQSMLDEYVSQAEAKGHIVSKNYYDALIKNEESRIKTLKQEQADLIAKRDEAASDPNFDKNSQEWYDMCAAIDETTQAIESGTTALIEWNNAIRDIDFEIFETIQERISDITAEADFLIELMSHKNIFDDNGKLTEQGQATIGLHGQNYNTYMYAADEYGNKVAEIDRKIASGELDGYSKDVVDKRREYLELQRECILNAENEKDAIRDLVEEGINFELDALGELIDKYNDALDSQKDLYDYQKRVEEQTKNVASLQKQIAAYEGDNSEETKAKVQELKVALEEAESDLAETEYDKYIADQQKLLDALYNEYELMLNERIDNINDLIAQQIEAVNTNAFDISNTLSSEADAVGYTLSSAMTDIWNGEHAVLTEYGEKFSSAQTNTNDVLGRIETGINNMIAALDKQAQQKINEPKTPSSANANPVNPPANNNNNGNKEGDKGDKRALTDDQLMGIAASIWVDGHASGWGNDPIRSGKLTEKFGLETAKKVQALINAHSANGGLYRFWLNHGKNLKKYHYSAFKFGAEKIDESQLAWTQEQGQEYIVRPSDGAILTPVAKGDSVLTSAASNNIWKMANSPAEFIKDNLNLGSAGVPSNSNVQSSYVQNFDKVVFSMPNVHNYQEFLSEMQKDKNFDRLIESMTIGKLAGKSSLAKGKAIR